MLAPIYLMPRADDIATADIAASYLWVDEDDTYATGDWTLVEDTEG